MRCGRPERPGTDARPGSCDGVDARNDGKHAGVLHRRGHARGTIVATACLVAFSATQVSIPLNGLRPPSRLQVPQCPITRCAHDVGETPTCATRPSSSAVYRTARITAVRAI